MSSAHSNTTTQKKVIGIIAFTCTLALGVAFFHFDRTGAITRCIQSWGSLGVILAILIMAGMCVSPLPSEGLLLIYFKLFGFGLGCFYGWLGAILSSLVVFVLARYLIGPMLRVTVSEVQLRKINHWIRKRGSFGLLIVRLLPVPAFIQSYVVGSMSEIPFWTYFWTGAVSIVPYYVGTCLVYRGVTSQMTEWVIGGGALMIVLWGAGFLLNRRG